LASCEFLTLDLPQNQRFWARTSRVSPKKSKEMGLSSIDCKKRSNEKGQSLIIQEEIKEKGQSQEGQSLIHTVASP